MFKIAFSHAFLNVTLNLSLVLACSFNLNAQGKIRSFPDKANSHILSVKENKPDPKIPIESITGFPGKTTLVTNHAKTFNAYVLCIPEKGPNCGSRVFFTDRGTGKTFMITGETDGVEQTRPVDTLKWVNNDRLSYERWMNPHFGHRYEIDVKSRKQVAAYTISDQADLK